MDDIETVRWYLDKRDDEAGWVALERIETRLRSLDEALRWLIVQVDDVKRTKVVRESFIYRNAVAALSASDRETP